MKRSSTIIFVMVLVGSVIIYIFIPLVGNFTPWVGTPVLEFPIQDPNNVTKLSGYNHPDWGEPGKFHNGIDLVCRNYTIIVSPIRGIVSAIEEKANPYKDFILFHISIMANYQWIVKLVFEPNYNTTEGNAWQRSLITVTLFQRVEVGDVIGILLNGTGDPTYPHIHFMVERPLWGVVCPYQYSSPTAKIYYENIANYTGETICYFGPNADATWIDLVDYLIIFGSLGICFSLMYVFFRRMKSK
ncbi:MAG: M23 family metallopeptidase [Candidatus Helarchaeota archaeon]